MKRVLAAAAAGALVLVATVSGGRVSAVASTARTQVATDLERQTLVALNDVRREHGLVPLRLSTALTAAARGHSFSMAEHGYFGHESVDGAAFWKRIRPLYPPQRGRYWATGENLYWAAPAGSGRDAVERWLRKPRHRRNVLNASWREVGLGGVRTTAAPGIYHRADVAILTADFGVR